MSRRKKDRLGAVQAVYSVRESQAALKVRQCEQALSQAQAQLGVLRSSRDEHGRFAAPTLMSAGQYANRAAFLDRLNDAISAQQQLVAQARGALSAARRQLANARQRTRAVEKVRERRALAARVASARREQSELDDLPAAERGEGDTSVAP